MASLGQVETKRANLEDIRAIMQAMRTLAQVETHKLAPLLKAQHAVVHGIQAVAADFLSSSGYAADTSEKRRKAWLLIGTERGFCGSFNRSIVEFWDSLHVSQVEDAKDANQEPPLLLVLGQRLSTILHEQGVDHHALAGASVVEEIESVLLRLIDRIITLQGTQGMDSPLELSAVYHDKDARKPVAVGLLPPFADELDTAQEHSHPPVLNLSASDFLSGLIDQALNAALHDLLYTSLMAESMVRIEHLENAVNHLDLQTAQLQQTANFLRQEEIIEEIEIILQSAAALDTTPNRMG